MNSKSAKSSGASIGNAKYRQHFADTIIAEHLSFGHLFATRFGRDEGGGHGCGNFRVELLDWLFRQDNTRAVSGPVL